MADATSSRDYAAWNVVKVGPGKIRRVNNDRGSGASRLHPGRRTGRRNCRGFDAHPATRSRPDPIAGGRPVIALDMYEHAYHMDYGAKAGAYVDAFMEAINWDNAVKLYERVSRDS